MRRLSKLFRTFFAGVALYFLFSQQAQSALYALCYNNSSKVQGIIWKLFEWYRTVDATTMRIMLVVILISIIFDWFHIFQILFDIGIGWLAMTGWRALAIQAPSGWGNALSDATIAIFATALVVALIDIRVSPRVKREKQPKKVSKNQEAKPKAQAKQQRLTREQKKAVEKRKQEAMDKMGYGDPENYQPQFPEEGVTTSHEVPVFLRRNREQG